MNASDDELIKELSERFTKSRKAFSDLSVVNRKLLELNEKLEASESLKSNFLSNIRNEINNPLNAILGLTAQLANVVSGNNEAASLASLVIAEASCLDFQLRNIFIAAELEAGEVSSSCVKVHIAPALREIVDAFIHTSAKKGVSIELILPLIKDTDVAVLDFDKFQIIVSNLLANAIEYSPNDGIVEICTNLYSDGSLQISIQDHGVGIAHEDQQRIFDRFVQLETGSTRSHLGHGLGLSITKSLVEYMQGSIELISSIGNGTLFTLKFPPCSIMDDADSFSESGNLFIFDDMSEANKQ